MRTTTAFFAGMGTVAVAVAAGLGGGLMLGETMHPHQPKYPSSEVTRLEQRSPQQPIQTANGTSQPVPNSAVAQPAAAPAEAPAPPQQPQSLQAQPQISQPLQPRSASARSAEPAQPPVRTTSAQSSVAAQPAPSAEPSAVRERAASEDSVATARDADVRRDVRRAEDRRKAERRQQRAERKKWRQYQDNDLDRVEASVREATESRPLFFGREPSFGSQRMTLFEN